MKKSLFQILSLYQSNELTIFFGFFTAIIVVLLLFKLVKWLQLEEALTKSPKIIALKELNNLFTFNVPKDSFEFQQTFNELSKFKKNSINLTISQFRRLNYSEILAVFEQIRKNKEKYEEYYDKYNSICSIETTKIYSKYNIPISKFVNTEKIRLRRLLIQPILICCFDIFFSYTSPAGRRYWESEHYKACAENIDNSKKKIDELFPSLTNQNEVYSSNVKREVFSKTEILIKNNISLITTSHLSQLGEVELNEVKAKKDNRFSIFCKYKINLLGKFSISISIKDLDTKEEINEKRLSYLSSNELYDDYLKLYDYYKEFEYFERADQFFSHINNIKTYYKEKINFNINLKEISHQAIEEIVRITKIYFSITEQGEIFITDKRIGQNFDINGYLLENPKSKYRLLFESLDNAVNKINKETDYGKRLQVLKKDLFSLQTKFVIFAFEEVTTITINVDWLTDRKKLSYDVDYYNLKSKISKSSFLGQTFDPKPINIVKEILHRLERLELSKNTNNSIVNKLAKIREDFPDKERLKIVFSENIINNEILFSYFNIKPKVKPIIIEDLIDSDLILNPLIENKMREYQKYAFNWLSKLSFNGLSGILADDMGLGKTLEIISLLEADQENLPNLVICPLSLTNNWKREFKKWAPDLKINIVNNSNLRFLDFFEGNKNITIISSYEFVVYHYDKFSKFKYKYLLIDEAQQIKNATTKRAKVIKRIKSTIRFAITGTPIENKEEDLWSIFEFLNPDLFEVYKLKLLSKEIKRTYIKPFILRRKKSDVLKELPLKNEILITLNMTQKQREVYDYYENTWVDFKDDFIKLLALLTRLRQICISPKLLEKDIDADSVKIQHITEMIQEITLSGESVLIYSSFVTSLKIVEAILDESNIPYAKLTGELNSTQRENEISRFEKNQNIKVFLISLKAGGVGLNLIKANHVIFMDPWWNIAVENQAADRVHRIGQEKKVNIYRLICLNTIEERVMEIQQEKMAIINYFVENNNDSPIGKMTIDLLNEIFSKKRIKE